MRKPIEIRLDRSRRPHETATAKSQSPLGHPLFWGALAVLLLNDHVLKGAGVLPAFLTGKLSDFAGLVVAPVLAAALLRGRLARAIAFSVVAAVFAAVNLSPWAAGLLESAMTGLGVSWRIWPDPTDLVAFAVLPVAWRIVSGTARRAPSPVLLQRAAVVLGGIACIATSEQPPNGILPWTTNAFVLNGTSEPLDLRVVWLSASVDCDLLDRRIGRALGLEAFGPGATFALAPGDTLPLYRPEAENAGAGNLTEDWDAQSNRCDAVLLRADGLVEVVVFWNDLPTQSVGVSLNGNTPVPFVGRVELEGSPPDIQVTPGNGIDAELLDRHPDPAPCEPTFAEAYQWSAGDETERRHRILSVDEGDDGCLLVDLDDDLGGRAPMFVCVPPSEFPFGPGDEVEITRDEWNLRILRSPTESAPGAELEIFARHAALTDPNGDVVPADWCEGERTSCGAFVLPAVLSLGGTLVRAGESIDPGLDGREWSRRLRVGRAEAVVVGLDSCEPARRRARAAADILVLHQEVP